MVGFKLLFGLTGLALAQSTDSTPVDPESILGPVSPASVDTTRYIVQFSEAGSAKFRKRDGSLDAESFFNILQDRDSDIEPATTFNSDLFHGASFDINSNTAELVTELKDLPEVEAIWPAALFTIPEVAEVVADDGFGRWSPHNDTQVALAHEHGYLGEGVVVAVVDSGIDYMHPALGGGFGPGFKVEKGYDLVGDDYEPGLPYAPDDDPQDCNGHGTHVAGIIASGNDYIPGVAPAARLWAYKVFGCPGSTYEDVIITAFLQAHEDGADIISASLGSNIGFPDGPLALVAGRIQAAGTFVSIAAGNAGEQGPFFSSSGGNALGATTVGSVQHSQLVGYSATAISSSGESRKIHYVSHDLIQWDVNGTLAAVFAPKGSGFDPCVWNSGGEMKGGVLVHARGTCEWQMHDSTLNWRADFVFYYNFEGADWVVPDRAYYNPLFQPKGFALISYEDGIWITSQNEAGHTVSFDFVHDNQPLGLDIESLAAGRINQFSSWGPTLDARMKPDISAPGGTIFSTYPLAYGGWAVLSGTSMATPYVSGIAALFFASQGGRKVLGSGAADIAHRRIVQSGRPVYHYDGTQNLGTVAQQGGGLVNAIKVLEYTLDVSPASINLNDTANFKETHTVQITNSGEEEETYYLSHQPSITIHTRPQGNAWVGANPPYSSGEENEATLTFSEAEIKLAPGESRTLSVSFKEPSNLDPALLAVYGGAIQIVGSRGQAVRVPYMGIKGSLFSADTWEMERGVPLLLSTSGGLIQEGSTFTFENEVRPQAYFNILWSTSEISFDFVDRSWEPSDWVYPPVPGKNNYHGSMFTTPMGLSQTPISFPSKNWARDSSGRFVIPESKFSHGPEIPVGEYRLLGRVLRTYGDPNNLDHWQWKVSPWFKVTREKPPQPSTTAQPTTSATPTPEPTRPCNAGSIAVNMTVRIGADEEQHGFYRYSDFLAVDIADNKQDLEFEFTEAGRLVTPVPSNIADDLFLSVAANDNSLVYLRTSRQVTGSFSFIDCEVVCGNKLRCVSNNKTALYICERTSGLVRSGPVVLDGCEKIRLSFETIPNPYCEVGLAPEPTVIPSVSN